MSFKREQLISKTLKCCWVKKFNTVKGHGKCVVCGQEFEHMLTGKYPSYYLALRVGRHLQSLCVASDPERNTLTEMLGQLRQKWFAFKSALTEK